MRKTLIVTLVTLMTGVLLSGCGSAAQAEDNGEVVVYNWGEYIDPETLTMFEEETGIKVIYDEFETNEIMYPKVANQSAAYDCICPSDYMIAKMIENNLLDEIDYSKVPNYSNIDPAVLKISEQFDPGNKYSVPYTFGTVGILYNKTMVDEPVDSWNILWDEKYAGNILMMDSVRDSFLVAEKMLGYSCNTTDKYELAQCRDLLINQKPLVQAYVVDQARDKMIGEEAALALIYSGEYLYTKAENDNLEYVVPKEGTNVWIDSWVIPKNAPNKENAHKFIDFMCRPDIAKMTFDYITYASPNLGARDLIDEEITSDKALFPDFNELNNLEAYVYIGEDGDELYNDMWKEVKSE